MRSRLFVMLALAGICSVSFAAKKKQAPPRTPAQLSATHGYVRASIPQWEFSTDFRLVALKDTQKPGRARLEARQGTRSWEGWIPAGEYVLAGDLNAYDSPKRATVDASGNPYAPVTVRAGEMTDLGVLLRVSLGEYQYKLVPTEDAEVPRETAQALERVGAVLKTQEVIRWRPTELPRAAQFAERENTTGLVEAIFQDVERGKQITAPLPSLKKLKSVPEFLSVAKASAAPTSSEVAIGPDGSLYYGAELGQVRVRDTTGVWSSRDTGTYVEVTAMEYGQGRLVAGNLRGQLFTSTDSGRNWTLAKALSPKEVIFDIDRAGSRWMVLAAPFEDLAADYYLSSLEHPPGLPKGWNLEPLVRVYSATRDDLSDLELLREFSAPGKIRMHEYVEADSAGGLTVGGDYYVYAVTGIHRLDVATMQWKDLKTPMPFVQFVRASPDGKWLTAAPLIGSKLVYSADRGNTWKGQKGTLSYAYDAVMTSADEGHGSRSTLGRFTREVEFFAYDGKSQHWKQMRESPRECFRMLRDANDNQNYCVTRSSAILVFDGGEWKLEFAPG
jgi:hypothetical protein